MPFSATKFIEKQITNTRGLCKSCKFYKTAFYYILGGVLNERM